MRAPALPATAQGPTVTGHQSLPEAENCRFGSLTQIQINLPPRLSKDSYGAHTPPSLLRITNNVGTDTIAASCRGVVLWFVRHRRVFIDPRVSLAAFARYFPSRVLMTLSLSLALSLSGHRCLLRNVIRTAVSFDCASYS